MRQSSPKKFPDARSSIYLLKIGPRAKNSGHPWSIESNISNQILVEEHRTSWRYVFYRFKVLRQGGLRFRLVPHPWFPHLLHQDHRLAAHGHLQVLVPQHAVARIRL